MVPDCAGHVATVTLNIIAVPEPQELLATTKMFPPVDPATAVMDVVAELPVHPDGNVHV